MNYKIKKRSAFYVGLLFALLFQKNSFSAVTKHSDSLYTEWVKLPIKAADKNNPKQQGDVLFVMQRLDEDPKALDFWKLLASSEKDYFKNDDMRDQKIDALAKVRQPFNLREVNPMNRYTGLTSLISALNHASKIRNKEGSPHYELWISWAMSPEKKEELQRNEKQSQNEIQLINELQPKDIEMVVSVSTVPQSPMVTHMGINRSFSYLTQSKAPVHENLSIKLHAFSARCMLERYPDKPYMITSPVPKMREIFEKVVAGEFFLEPRLSVYTACSEKVSPEYYKLFEKLKTEGYKLIRTMQEVEKEIEKKTEGSSPEEKGQDLKQLLEKIKKDFEANNQEEKALNIKHSLALQECMNELYKQTFNDPDTKTIFLISKSEANLEKKGSFSDYQIYTPNRKHLLFHHYEKGEEKWIRSRSSAEEEFQQTNGADEISRQWGWFLHPDMGIHPQVAIPLKALSEL